MFSIANNMEGFKCLLKKVHACSTPQDAIKVGLEANGHYGYNLIGFFLDNGLSTYVLNPLHTNLYRKSLSLRKTKTDRVDARTIAAMLMSDVDSQILHSQAGVHPASGARKTGFNTPFGLYLRLIA